MTGSHRRQHSWARAVATGDRAVLRWLRQQGLRPARLDAPVGAPGGAGAARRRAPLFLRDGAGVRSGAARIDRQRRRRAATTSCRRSTSCSRSTTTFADRSAARRSSSIKRARRRPASSRRSSTRPRAPRRSPSRGPMPGCGPCSAIRRNPHEVGIRLVDPRGRTVPEHASFVRRHVADTFVVFRIEDPAPGRWHLQVQTHGADARRLHGRRVRGFAAAAGDRRRIRVA